MSRDRHAPAQKERILDFSRGHFFRYGFAHVTIEEIVAEMHISKTTFYKFFTSKEDLLVEVIRAYYERISEGLKGILAQGAVSYREQLDRAMHFLCDTLAQLDARSRQDIRVNAPQVWETLQGLQRRALLSVLEKLLRKGMEMKAVRKSLDLKLTTEIVVLSIENALNDVNSGYLSRSLKDGYNALIGLLLDGILERPEPPALGTGEQQPSTLSGA